MILGIPQGTFAGNPLIRVDIEDTSDLRIGFPSGNEKSANIQWLPGGRLPNGNNEAVVDLGNSPSGIWTIQTIPVN